VSYVFQRREREYAETNQLSFRCYILLDILEETLGGNHGTKQHLPPHNVDLPLQQTFGLPSYMHQIEIGNYGWLQGGPPVEAEDNGREATRCCYNNHCNIDEQSLHREIRGYTSAVNKEKLGRESNVHYLFVFWEERGKT
jgi:hypothetical protein